MKKKRAASFDEFFNSNMGIDAWNKGLAEFREAPEIHRDGTYLVQLRQARFVVPPKARPLVVFDFYVVGTSGHRLSKIIDVSTAAGVAALLRDMALLLPDIRLESGSKPASMEELLEAVNAVQPTITLFLASNALGIQAVHLVTLPAMSAARPPEAPPEAEVVAAEVLPPPPPPVVLKAAPEAVGLVVGMTVRFNTDDNSRVLQGTVLNIYEDDKEIMVKVPEGFKLVVPEDKVLGIVPEGVGEPSPLS